MVLFMAAHYTILTATSAQKLWTKERAVINDYYSPETSALANNLLESVSRRVPIALDSGIVHPNPIHIS